MRNEQNKHQWKQGMMQLSQKMEIPRDIAFSLPNIQMIGNQEICVENFKSIVEYKADRIVLRMKKNILCIGGNRLCINRYSKDELVISGLIKEIKYQ